MFAGLIEAALLALAPILLLREQGAPTGASVGEARTGGCGERSAVAKGFPGINAVGANGRGLFAARAAGGLRVHERRRSDCRSDG
jgi:hypothetical protein